MPQSHRWVACSVIALGVTTVPVTTANELPALTGKLAAGMMTFVWTDAGRDELLTEDANDKREFSVSVWYPADSRSRPSTPYLPDFESWSSKLGEQRLRESLGGASDAVRSSNALAHAGATLARGAQRLPLLVFLPGLGMNTPVYSSLLADLAGHGRRGGHRPE